MQYRVIDFFISVFRSRIYSRDILQKQLLRFAVFQRSICVFYLYFQRRNECFCHFLQKIFCLPRGVFDRISSRNKQIQRVCFFDNRFLQRIDSGECGGDFYISLRDLRFPCLRSSRSDSESYHNGGNDCRRRIERVLFRQPFKL